MSASASSVRARLSADKADHGLDGEARGCAIGDCSPLRVRHSRSAPSGSVMDRKTLSSWFIDTASLQVKNTFICMDEEDEDEDQPSIRRVKTEPTTASRYSHLSSPCGASSGYSTEGPPSEEKKDRTPLSFCTTPSPRTPASQLPFFRPPAPPSEPALPPPPTRAHAPAQTFCQPAPQPVFVQAVLVPTSWPAAAPTTKPPRPLAGPCAAECPAHLRAGRSERSGCSERSREELGARLAGPYAPDTSAHTSVLEGGIGARRSLRTLGRLALGGRPGRAPSTPTVPLQSQLCSTADGYARVRWTADARKLKGSDKQLVSPPLNVDLGMRSGPAVFKVMLTASGGSTFKKSEGFGCVQVKCVSEPDDDACTNVRVFIGSEDRAQLPRGPLRHCFSSNPVFTLPKELAEWNFYSAAEQQSNAMVVNVDIAPLV